MRNLTRRDLLKTGALLAATSAGTLWRPGRLFSAGDKLDDGPVRIGYLPITDATPLLVAHARKLYEAEGLTVEKPRLFRSWAQIVEAFVSRQVNVIHLLSPTTIWVRYGTKFPGKVVAWNHLNGSALVGGPGGVRHRLWAEGGRDCVWLAPAGLSGARAARGALIRRASST